MTSTVRKYVKAFTYEPKIKAVRDGSITQTIRPDPKGSYVQVGDEILFHGWSGKPYRSPWSWRLRVKVTEIMNLYIYRDMFFIREAPDWPRRWDSPLANELAQLDGIKPPTGEALRDVLAGMDKYGLDEYETRKDRSHAYQVIRWRDNNVV